MIRLPHVKWMTTATASLAVVLVLGGGAKSIPNPVSGVTDQIAATTHNIAQNVQTVADKSTESHLGFDTSEYPGDDAMAAWHEGASPYEWVGYYLPSPCHKDDSWTGKRETLTNMGWGLAVVYVGQQTWGQTPGQPHTITKYVKRRVKQTTTSHGRKVTHYVTKTVAVHTVVAPHVLPGASCSPHLVTAAEGAIDARDAIARAAAEGFPRGTVVFLDIERMETVPAAMRDYYKAWTAGVLADGRYVPGVYAHSHNADLIHGDVAAMYAAAGSTVTPPFWIAGPGSFAPEQLPTAVGHAFAAVWQGILDVAETHNGVRLKIDKSVASLPSPSQEQVATANGL